jgi:hypothetical protein
MQYFREYYHNDKDKYLEYFYKRKYGITLADYRAMEAEQGGACYLCSRKCATGRRLAVDHDHATGKARRLLCSNCNKGIGNFQEDVDLLRRTIDYLEAHRTWTTAKQPSRPSVSPTCT